MGVRLARRQRPKTNLDKRMIAHDHAGDKHPLRVVLVALARASARAATVVAVAAFAVTLTLAESVAAFEPSGAAFEPVAVIGGNGGGAGELGIPLGVATDGAGGLYATEHVNQRVSRFTTAGQFTRAWGFDVMPGGGEGFEVCTRATGCKPGEPGGRAGQLGFPGGIAVDDTGNVYVTDPANDRVSQFTTEGAFVRAFGYDVVPGGGKGFEICNQATGCKPGIAGAHAGQLAGPSYVASDGAGSIFVTDQANIRVNQFTDAGAFVQAFGYDVVPAAGKGSRSAPRLRAASAGSPAAVPVS
jgi:NHL repeat